MEALTIQHPLLTDETSVQDILNRASILGSNVMVYDRSMVASMSNRQIQKNIEAFSMLFEGDRVHEPATYGSQRERDLAVLSVLEDLNAEQIARSQGKVRVRVQDQSFLISPEAQAAMLKMVQERESTGSWNGDLSAGVKIIAAANPSDDC